MKILMLTDVFFPDTIGGAGRMAYYLSLGLSEKGHEIHVITRAKNTSNLPAFQKLNASLFIHRFFVPAAESFSMVFSELIHSRILAAQLSRTIEFDLICTHQTLAALGPVSFKNFAAKPILHWYYSPWHEEYSIKKYGDQNKINLKTRLIAFILRRLEKRHIRKARKIIVLSQYTKKQLTDIHRFSEEKIHFIPGCVDLNHFRLPVAGKKIIKNRLGVPLHKTIFFTVRNLVPRMGLENLIQSFIESEVLRRESLLLIGGKGFLETPLKATVAKHRLQECIQFPGYISEERLPQFYQAADFFILPTKKLEGFGLVILEALACGTPVLGTPVGAILELLKPLAAHFIIEGTEGYCIRKKMEEVISQPEKYRLDPQTCRTYVQNRYSRVHMADAFERLVWQVLNRVAQ
ncbi:MAG: glycosyltransferase family 1 protein [Desulfobacteraceae bacterium]|nr:MAG: glycosyltransferase family 1 protein [Desulfobacteraceae bacterium]